MKSNGKSQSLVALIGISLLAGDTVEVTDAGVLIEQGYFSGGNRILVATTTRERAQEMYDEGLRLAEECVDV